MRALRYSSFGAIADVLRIEEVPEPQPGADEVVVRARYVGVNPLDWKLVEGHYRLFAKSRPPCGVGAELAGEVLSVGSGTGTLRPGDRVAAWLNPFAEPPRALAERVCLPASQCVRVPDGVGLDVAAVTPVAGLSARQMISLARAESGQRILVHGAAGGVGSFVVPMLKDRGAIVIATGGAASQSFLGRLGADVCVDYATPIESWPGPFDAIIDCASSLARAAVPRLLAAGHVVTTLPSFPHLIVDPVLNPLRRVRWHALRLQPNAAELTEILASIAAGRLPVHLSRTYRFDEAIEALAASRGGRVRGKLAVAVD